MRLRTNIFAQITGLGLQALNIWGGLIPPKYQGFVAMGVALAQGLTAQKAQYSNPDGTKATTPWIPGPNVGETKL